MGVAKITGVPELDSQLAALTKQFGEDFFTQQFPACEAIPTGSLGLDVATRIGGIPRGRVVEIYGLESSGKTSLCFSIAAQYQKMQSQWESHEDRMILIIDIEHSITQPFVEGFGIDYSKCIHSRPKTVSQALTIARDLPKSGKIGVVIFDSVAGAQTQKQMEKDFDKADVGGISKHMHEALRTISKVAPDTDTTYLFINQVTYKVGVMFGNPETTTGGKALPYYACMRLGMMQGKPYPDLPHTLLMRVKITKTKVGIPWGKTPVEIAFGYGKGIDPIYDTLKTAKEFRIIRSAGRASYLALPDKEEEKLPVGSKEELFYYMRENLELLEEVRQAVLIAGESYSPE